MFRFFTQNLSKGRFIISDPFDFKHIVTVLRLNSGERIEVVNSGVVYEGIIDSVSNEAVEGTILRKLEDISTESTVKLRLFQALIKPKLFELVLEKVAELGVAEIVPLVTERCQFDSKIYAGKLPRFKKIVMVAAKQSKQASIPLVTMPQKLEQVVEGQNSADINVVFNLVEASITPVTLLSKIPKFGIINCFVGPEGGFSKIDEEVLSRLNNGFIVKLSETILRAETAGILGPGVIKALTIDK